MYFYKIAWLLILSSLTFDVYAGVNLRISDDETYKRPNSWSKDSHFPSERLYAESFTPLSRPGVSIAWRNANQIEEVEVRVQNLGNEPGEGRVHVDVVDATGKILLRLEPPDEMKQIRVPAVDKGGKEGKIIRMQASWELNSLIDRFDRARVQYGVRANVETIGAEEDWSDNSKTKEWNIPFAVKPGQVSVYNYVFRNHDSTTHRVRWQIDQSNLPQGWKLQGLPNTKSEFVFQPDQELKGTLMMKAPESIEQGSFLETRLAILEIDTGRVLQQHEWFQVYDIIPPTISNYRMVLLANHTVAIQALVADQHSGVLEATGVKTEFSVDSGMTWAEKAHNYKVGNFLNPTLFETVLGPFAPDTKVLLRMTAFDTAGNSQTIIPADASAFSAPPNAEVLIQQAYIFPRAQQNPVFELEKLKELNLTLSKLKDMKINIEELDLSKPNIAGIDPDRLAELKLDQQRLKDLKDDLARVADLEFDVSKIKPVTLQRVKPLGAMDENMVALEVKVP